jgi:dolichyl-phosphate-mannose--protein O-mannosyl transferase
VTAQRLTILAVIVILALSAGVRLYHLSRPHDYIFDEIYYGKDARTILRGKIGPQGFFKWEPGNEVSWPHPEMGKFAIAAGIATFGDTPFGRRFPAALAGLVLLACVYPLARRLGLSPRWSLAALALAAADTLGIAQSRIATLDIFVGAWTALCLLCALRYAQDGRRSRWLVASGIAGGMALGTKWSGALVCLAALAILFLWRERPRGDETGMLERLADGLRAATLPLLLLVLLPAAIYVASYADYFAHGHSLSQWWELQKQMVQFNFHLHATHTYASAAPTWILDYRPVWYYFKGTVLYHGIVAIGNPILWWTSVPALVALPVAAIVTRRRELAVTALIVAILYFPWFATSRTSFLYYMTPVAPFMAILVASGLSLLAGDRLDPRPSFAGPATANGAADAGDSLAGPAAAVDWLRLLLDLIAFLAGAVATPLLWHPLALAARTLFWTAPHRLAPAAGVVGVAVGCALALAALAVSWFVPSVRRVWPRAGWLYVGVVVGICIVMLPVVIDLGISPAHYYRLMWFSRWI